MWSDYNFQTERKNKLEKMAPGNFDRIVELFSNEVKENYVPRPEAYLSCYDHLARHEFILFWALSFNTYDIVHIVYLHGKSRADFYNRKTECSCLELRASRRE